MGKAGAENISSPVKSSAPCSPFFMIRDSGPILRIIPAARIKFGSSANSLASESFMTSKSTLCNVFFSASGAPDIQKFIRSEEHTSELQSRGHLVCRLLLEKQ